MRKDGAANRERILLAAEQVFGAAGAAASTEEIARQAEVGVATVFRHFPTKQDLIEATAARYLEKLAHQVRHLADETDPGQAFAALLHTLVSTGPTKITLLRLLPTDGHGPTEAVTLARKGFHDAVQVVFERAHTAGAVRPDTIIDDIYTLARALALATTPGTEAATNRAVEIVLNGLGVHR